MTRLFAFLTFTAVIAAAFAPAVYTYNALI